MSAQHTAVLSLGSQDTNSHGIGRSLASLRRFWAVAAKRNPSRAPSC